VLTSLKSCQPNAKLDLCIHNTPFSPFLSVLFGVWSSYRVCGSFTSPNPPIRPYITHMHCTRLSSFPGFIARLWCTHFFAWLSPFADWAEFYPRKCLKPYSDSHFHQTNDVNAKLELGKCRPSAIKNHFEQSGARQQFTHEKIMINCSLICRKLCKC